MRSFVIALAAVLTAALTVHAQTAPPPPQPDAKKLDEYLLRWEQEMQKIQSLVALLERTEKDKTFQTEKKFTGFAQYLKSGTGASALNLAVLEMKEAGKQDIHEKFVCTGTFLYQFSPAKQEIYAHRLPPPKPGQVGDDNFMSFLFGMKAENAKQRYTLTLTPGKENDPHYIYLDVEPKAAVDKADFKRAQLVLNKDSFLPRQLWFEQANGNQVIWGIPRIDPKAKVNPADFDAPKPPPGWRLVPVEKQPEAQPTIIRPKP